MRQQIRTFRVIAWRLIRIAVLSLVPTLTAACAGPSQTGLPPGVELLDELTPTAPLTPEAIGPAAAVWTYEIVPPDEMLQQLTSVESDHQPTAETDTARGSSQNTSTVIRTRTREWPQKTWVTTLGPDRSEMMAMDETGNLVLVEARDTSHDARTVYNPPLILIYAIHEPGVVYTQESQATVHSIRNPDLKQDEGAVEFEVVYECDQVIDSPYTGTVLAHRIRATQSIDFRRADVKTTSTQWLVEGFGPVWIYEHERVRVLGPLGWTMETAMRLVDFIEGTQPSSKGESSAG